MKQWVVVFVLLLTSCAGTRTQMPVPTASVVPLTSTPQITQVTRIVTVEQTVVVTATPVAALAQDCFNNAMTQGEINECAVLEWELADAELEKVISQIEFSPEEKQAFDKLQQAWLTQVENDCEFFYGQLLKDENGNLYYKNGSMAPMQRSMCVASRIHQRTDELKLIYLMPDI